MQRMDRDVKSARRPLSRLRADHVAETERRIVDAARRLFIRDGYVATSLAAVALEAGVAERTLYVRFRTKALLFQRVVEVAIVGDTARVPVRERAWAEASFTARTAAERVAAYARASRRIMGGAADLFAVALQAAAVEPVVAAQWEEGRRQHHGTASAFVERLHADGLLDPSVDVDEAADTVWVISSPHSYLQLTRERGWDPEQWEAWLTGTLSRLLTSPRRGARR